MKNVIGIKREASRALRCAPLPASQRGSIAVMAALLISTMVILLASIDIGFLFFQKRELQKIADMSALAGAQQLSRSSADDQCASAYRIAIDNAQVAHGFTELPVVSCGRWIAADATTEPRYEAHESGTPPPGQSAPNAVRVQVTRSYGSFFGVWASQRVNAEAIATSSSPTATFSVGSRLLRVSEDGVVPGILSKLGVNIDNTSLVSYKGLANVHVTPGGLLKQLGLNIPVNADIGTIKQLVLANTPSCNEGICPLNVLLGAISEVGGQSDLINLLGIEQGRLLLPVRLLSDENGRGIFTLVDTANGQAALEANTNVLDLVTTAIGVANNHNAVSLPLGANLPAGILQSETKIGIVEPPSIGIGGVGTTAYTSQVRIFTRLESNLLNANFLKVDLPAVIDVTNGSAKIIEMCRQKIDGKDTATISIEAPILSLCVGDLNKDTAFSTTGTCSANLQSHPILNVLNDKLKINTSIAVDGLQNQGSWTFVKGETHIFPHNQFALGTTTADVIKTLTNNLLDSLLAQILGQVLTQGQGDINKTNIASNLLSTVSQTGDVLKTAVKTVDDSLNTLQSFVNRVNANPDLLTALGNVLTGLLNVVGNLVGGLVNALDNLLKNLLGNITCLLSGNYNQCMLEKELSGNQSGNGTTISNVLLTILGLITELLEKPLNMLGAALSDQLHALIGAQLGQVDVTLIDLNCGGGDSARLVY